jgi:hypothetical protein
MPYEIYQSWSLSLIKQMPYEIYQSWSLSLIKGEEVHDMWGTPLMKYLIEIYHPRNTPHY